MLHLVALPGDLMPIVRSRPVATIILACAAVMAGALPARAQATAPETATIRPIVAYYSGGGDLALVSGRSDQQAGRQSRHGEIHPEPVCQLPHGKSTQIDVSR